MTSETLSGNQEKFALPTPSKMPATGSTETGSIMHLPIFWRREKAFWKLNMAVSLRFRERGLGEVAAGRKAEAADLRFHRGDCGEADAEFVDAEADEDRHRVRVTGDA